MGRGFISLLLTVGACTWVYTKFMRTTGNDTSRSVTAVAVMGVVLFAIAYFILGLILPE